MTGPEDSPGGTRPISVAELLAKNGTIGAPPVGGRRRRRRRGNTDAVTVAELTGEIPIVAEEALEEAPEAAPEATLEEAPEAAPEEAHDEYVEANGAPTSNGAADQAVEEEPADQAVEEEPVEEEAVEQAEDSDYPDAVADYTAHREQRDSHPEPLEFEPHPRRPHYAHALRRYHPPAEGGAEEMSPDPVLEDDDEAIESEVDLAEPLETEQLDTTAAADTEDAHELPSYLRSSETPLFGGQTIADDMARRGASPQLDDIDLEDEVETETAQQPASKMSALVQGAWIVGQCIVAVAFGAGLFVAFDQLWKWNNIVALVLSVLVILGLVVGVRVVRKTEDIGSTLIAVAVGALVTLGPLALLQSG